MEDLWYRPLVWLDYRLAVLITVFIPITISIWSLVKGSQAVQRLMIIYWRVASLLAITVYLLIPGWQIGYATGFVARFLIPISLWFWVDINEELEDLPQRSLKLGVTAWRWAISVYCVIGAIAFLPFLSCAFTSEPSVVASCAIWLEAPLRYKEIFHNESTLGFLGFLGMSGLTIYVLYFLYFVLMRLGRQGRIAMQQ
jgi:hypothetical protein